LICFVFAIAGIMVCFNNLFTGCKCEKQICHNFQNVRQRGAEANGGVPDIKAKVKKKISELFFSDRFGDTWENLMAEHYISASTSP
jgi:hypothetical protein